MSYWQDTTKNFYSRRAVFMPKIEAELYLDSTGTVLSPSFHGEICAGNGERPNIACCCDECDFYLVCFPDWRDFL